MPNREKRRKARKRKSKSIIAKKSGDEKTRQKAKRKIHPTNLFTTDLRKQPQENSERIKSTLQDFKIEDLFSRKKLLPLIKYKNRKIWYFEAGPNIRITATFHGEDLYLLSIEDHDSLNKAHKRVIQTIRTLASD